MQFFFIKFIDVVNCATDRSVLSGVLKLKPPCSFLITKTIQSPCLKTPHTPYLKSLFLVVFFMWFMGEIQSTDGLVLNNPIKSGCCLDV